MTPERDGLFKNTTTVLAGTILALVTWASGMPARAATVPTGFIAATDPWTRGKGNAISLKFGTQVPLELPFVFVNGSAHSRRNS